MKKNQPSWKDIHEMAAAIAKNNDKIPYDTKILQHILKSKGYTKQNPFPTHRLKATLIVRGGGKTTFLEYFPTEIWPDKEGISFSHKEKPMPARPDFAIERTVRVTNRNEQDSPVTQEWLGGGSDFLRFYAKQREKETTEKMKELICGHHFTDNRRLYAWLKRQGIKRLTDIKRYCPEKTDGWNPTTDFEEENQPRPERGCDGYLIAEKDSVMFYICIKTNGEVSECSVPDNQSHYNYEFNYDGTPAVKR